MRSEHPELASPEKRCFRLFGHLCRLFLGPGFRLGARWNRLGEAVKTREKREFSGGKWARYGLRSVNKERTVVEGSPGRSWPGQDSRTFCFVEALLRKTVSAVAIVTWSEVIPIMYSPRKVVSPCKQPLSTSSMYPKGTRTAMSSRTPSRTAGGGVTPAAASGSGSGSAPGSAASLPLSSSLSTHRPSVMKPAACASSGVIVCVKSCVSRKSPPPSATTRAAYSSPNSYLLTRKHHAWYTMSYGP